MRVFYLDFPANTVLILTHNQIFVSMSLSPNLSDPISNTRHNLNTPKRQIYT